MKRPAARNPPGEREPPEGDSLEALLHRRCPQCGSYLFKEVGRLYCLICSWEHNTT